ncbi:MAG: excinuclease ABC subunit C [Candidatus Wallbacteria bacterium]|nr:excinuclease ABC subunit C [Candidatus Wallbacteria bacterium]
MEVPNDGAGPQTPDSEGGLSLAAKLKLLPRQPGVYVFRDAGGAVLYVGKSRSLRDRVHSYFGSNLPSARIEAMVQRIADLDTFVTRTEEEALILEYELIGRHEPRYNIVFRDDKSYPVIKITSEEFPRAIFTRRIKKDGGVYLGPYPNAGAVRKVLALVEDLFKIRSCHYPSSKLRDVKLCLQYHIKRCTGPCEAKVSAEEYRQQVEDAVKFLRGREEDLLRDLESRMREASAATQFEKAARLRDRMDAVRTLRQRQAVSAVSDHEGDVVAVEGLDDWFSCACLNEVAGGS